MNILKPTQIVDKNGVTTTRNKKVEPISKTDRAIIPPSNVQKSEDYLKIEAILVKENSVIGHHKHAKLLKDTIELVMSQPKNFSVEEAYQATKTDAKLLGFSDLHWNITSTAAKRGWSEYEPSGQENYLESQPSSSAPWAERYRSVLAHMIAQHGSPMRKDADQYGWRDRAYADHFNDRGENCKIVEINTLVEDSWTEFEDSIVGNSEHTGVQADARCGCGWFRGTLRTEGTLTELVGQMNNYVIIDDIFDDSLNS